MRKKKNAPKSIINGNVFIKKYHTIEDLERMHKGELLNLYTERVESLVKLLPYIAFATKPGVTLTALGIPNDSNNIKILDRNLEATQNYLEINGQFQRQILPYSDTKNLIAAILFYEETMKSLHEYSEFNLN